MIKHKRFHLIFLYDFFHLTTKRYLPQCWRASRRWHRRNNDSMILPVCRLPLRHPISPRSLWLPVLRDTAVRRSFQPMSESAITSFRHRVTGLQNLAERDSRPLQIVPLPGILNCSSNVTQPAFCLIDRPEYVLDNKLTFITNIIDLQKWHMKKQKRKPANKKSMGS